MFLDKNNSNRTAKKKDLENAFFVSDRYQFELSDGKLFVMGGIYTEEKHTFDDFLFDENKYEVISVSMVSENAEIKTKGSEYFITADGISFKLKKISKHIVTDELGNEYIRNVIKAK